MRHPQPAPDRPSTRALIVLAVTYTVAAGLHGVLVATARTWWTGVLAGILAAVAVALGVTVRRRRREARRVRPDPRVTSAREEPGPRTVRHRDADPTRA
jgi:hypothetical protein